MQTVTITRHSMEMLRTLALLVSLLLVSVDSVMFHLEANARKCLAEEIRQNILVTGEFEVSEAPGQQVSSYQYRGIKTMAYEFQRKD